MKTKFDTVRLLFATTLLGVFASSASVGPGPQYEECAFIAKVADKN
jgi:hypothetical protein